MSRYWGWARYVPVAERRQKAEKQIAKMKKKGTTLNPVSIEGRTIAKTFWGKAWCDNLESYSDLSNRLPRGRSYVRNGSIMDLQVTKGQVHALVMGSSLYKVHVEVKPMAESKWKALVQSCAGKIESLIELLQGKFSKAVMQIITERERGLFPKPQEISMSCSCPDYAGMCKHIAAVLYGVGATLDVKPEWLFELRHVDHLELIATASSGATLIQNQESDHQVAESDLSALFGIELAASEPVKKKQKAKVEPKEKEKKKPKLKKKEEMVTLIII